MSKVWLAAAAKIWWGKKSLSFWRERGWMEKVSLETWEERNKEPAGWEVSGTSQQRQQQILQAGARQGWPEGILQTMASRLQLIRLGLPMTSAFPDFLLLPKHEVLCSECVNNFWVIIKKGGDFTSKSWALSSSYTWELMAQEATQTRAEGPGSPETLDFHRLWGGMVALQDSRRFYFDLKAERVLCGCWVCVWRKI